MKKSFRLLLILIVVGGALNTAEAQPLPIRVGYVTLGGSMSPLWMAKELGLFERHGVQSSPIYMAPGIALQAMLAGETDFVVGNGIPPIQARLGGADSYHSTHLRWVRLVHMARPPISARGWSNFLISARVILSLPV